MATHIRNCCCTPSRLIVTVVVKSIMLKVQLRAIEKIEQFGPVHGYQTALQSSLHQFLWIRRSILPLKVENISGVI